jgi:hypothetical protein
LINLDYDQELIANQVKMKSEDKNKRAQTEKFGDLSAKTEKFDFEIEFENNSSLAAFLIFEVVSMLMMMRVIVEG